MHLLASHLTVEHNGRCACHISWQASILSEGHLLQLFTSFGWSFLWARRQLSSTAPVCNYRQSMWHHGVHCYSYKQWPAKVAAFDLSAKCIFIDNLFLDSLGLTVTATSNARITWHQFAFSKVSFCAKSTAFKATSCSSSWQHKPFFIFLTPNCTL